MYAYTMFNVYYFQVQTQHSRLCFYIKKPRLFTGQTHLITEAFKVTFAGYFMHHKLDVQRERNTHSATPGEIGA